MATQIQARGFPLALDPKRAERNLALEWSEGESEHLAEALEKLASQSPEDRKARLDGAIRKLMRLGEPRPQELRRALELGADPSEPMPGGWWPLRSMAACGDRWASCASLLMEFGADPNQEPRAKSELIGGAMEQARASGAVSIQESLRRAGWRRSAESLARSALESLHEGRLDWRLDEAIELIESQKTAWSPKEQSQWIWGAWKRWGAEAAWSVAAAVSESWTGERRAELAAEMAAAPILEGDRAGFPSWARVIEGIEALESVIEGVEKRSEAIAAAAGGRLASKALAARNVSLADQGEDPDLQSALSRLLESGAPSDALLMGAERVIQKGIEALKTATSKEEIKTQAMSRLTALMKSVSMAQAKQLEMSARVREPSRAASMAARRI